MQLRQQHSVGSCTHLLLPSVSRSHSIDSYKNTYWGAPSTCTCTNTVHVYTQRHTQDDPKPMNMYSSPAPHTTRHMTVLNAGGWPPTHILGQRHEPCTKRDNSERLCITIRESPRCHLQCKTTHAAPHQHTTALANRGSAPICTCTPPTSRGTESTLEQNQHWCDVQHMHPHQVSLSLNFCAACRASACCAAGSLMCLWQSTSSCAHTSGTPSLCTQWAGMRQQSLVWKVSWVFGKGFRLRV
jgi:hypothetical protein